MKKKKKLQNSNGITICDSIVMSVKRKRVNVRRIESSTIAIMGFVSVIMSFLTMFEFNYSVKAVILAAAAFSAFYGILSLSGKKAGWIIITSVIGVMFLAFRASETLTEGFKYVYNVIYHTSFHTEINYYKFLDPELESRFTTAFFIFCIWLISVVVYYFTIQHPNPILPLLVTFPVIEIGLYNGIELPVFWGVLVIAYWLALLAMSTIDVGEYAGGNGGFVRKENLFFPKRQMRLKVTEKCGVFVILTVMLSALITFGTIKLSNYERSERINRKRIEIRDAVSSFSMENLADSISNVTSAFGLTFKYENHRLGNIDHLRYKDTTDLVITIDKQVNGPVYLKDYTGSSYSGNEWFDLTAAAYSDDLFSRFKDCSIYPQDFPYIFDRALYPNGTEFDLKIKSNLKNSHSFSPYGIQGASDYSYNHDTDVSSRKQNENEYSYSFVIADEYAVNDLGNTTRNVYSAGNITDEFWRKTILEYCQDYNLMSYDDYFSIDSEIYTGNKNIYEEPRLLMAELLQSGYRDFVYENYLELPDNADMDELKAAYSEVINDSKYYGMSQQAKTVALMNDIRESISASVQYSLDPGRTPSNRDFVNYFLLENKKGYCTHYATAGVILARMAGIPARYATGYVIVGDDFNNKTKNSDGSYTINVKDNRSHAWAEIYLDGYGWIPFECTAGYTGQTIDTTPQTTVTTEAAATDTTTTAVPNGTQTNASTSNGTRRNTGTKAAATTQQTTSAANGETGYSPSSGTGTPVQIPQTVKEIFRIIIIAAAVIGLVFLRRFLKLYFRNRRFQTGAHSRRMAYMYKYAEKLLRELEIEKEDLQYSEFASLAEKQLSGKYFDSGDFDRFMNTALRSSFGKSAPTDNELRSAERFLNNLSQKIYENSKPLKKFIIKFVKILI